MFVYMPNTDICIKVTDENDIKLNEFDISLKNQLKQAIISGKGKKFVQHDGCYHIQTAMESKYIRL